MTKEVWKYIPGYEGSYMVSNMGRVKSLDRVVRCRDGRFLTLKGKILKPRKTGTAKHGRVTLQKTDGKWYKFTVHRLVYCTFRRKSLSSKGDGKYVLHKNDIWWDNRLENLYMGTQKQNGRDMKRNRVFKKDMLLV